MVAMASRVDDLRRSNRWMPCMAVIFLLLHMLGDHRVEAWKKKNKPKEDATPSSYTFTDDASWAIRTTNVSDVLQNNKKALYDAFIDKCQVAMNKGSGNDTSKSCQTEDDFRLKMNSGQPGSVYNYTELGYTKIRAPTELFGLLQDFYNQNKGKDVIEWNHLNTYHNMWDVPPTIMHLNSNKFKGGGSHLQSEIWKECEKVMEQWTGQKLAPVSLYGIRLYHRDSILAPHVDRMPLVTSAIINIDQDVDEPWPLEVYGHDGKATNITMEPGDMVLYESHSVIHGRPFPFRGNYYANTFIHFEPIGELQMKGEAEMTQKQMKENSTDPLTDLPPYLIPGSEWEKEWIRSHPEGWTGNRVSVREAIWKGNLDMVKKWAESEPESVVHVDELGWKPLHEAVRSGMVDIVDFLWTEGFETDLNVITKNGDSPLTLSIQYLGTDHDMTKYLESKDALRLTSFHMEQAKDEL